MILRKLVQSGPSSFTLALPRKWIRSHKLSKGDMVEVQIYPEKVVVKPTSLGKSAPLEGEPVMISVDGKGFREMQRDLRAAYLSANRIVLHGDSLAEKRAEISKEIAELVALEIVDESTKSMVCRSFVSMQEVDLVNLARRIDNVVRSMLLDLPACLDSGDLAEALKERDGNVNRLGYLIMKCLKKALEDPSMLEVLKVTPKEVVVFWELNLQLEKIGDEAKRIGRLLAQLGTKRHIDREGIIHLCKLTTENYVSAMKSFYTKDPGLSDRVALQRTEISKLCEAYSEKHKDLVVSEMAGKFKGMLSRVSDIAGLVRYVVVV